MKALTPVTFAKERENAPRLTTPYVPGRHSETFWRPEEDAVLRQHFTKSGPTTCQVHLAKLGTPKRSIAAISQHARRTLGLASPLKSTEPRRSHADIKTPEWDLRIKEGWARLQGRGSVGAFAAELGIPRFVLTDRATAMGLTLPHRKEPKWTAAEESLLSTMPLGDPDRCSRIMREHGFSRTPAAIVIRAKRLKMSRRRTDVFSAARAASILGIDNKTMSTWCITGEMTASRRGTARLPQQGGDTWTITKDDLRRFVIENLDRIDMRKVEKFDFVDLLTHGAVKTATMGRGPKIEIEDLA